MKKGIPYKNLKECEMHNLRIEFDTYEDELYKYIPSYGSFYMNCANMEEIMNILDTDEKYCCSNAEIGIIIHFKNQETLELNNNIFDSFTLDSWEIRDEIHADYCGEVDVEGFEDMDEKFLVPMIEVQRKCNSDGNVHEFRFPLSSVCFVEQYWKTFSWRERWLDLSNEEREHRNDLFLKAKATWKKFQERKKKGNK